MKKINSFEELKKLVKKGDIITLIETIDAPEGNIKTEFKLRVDKKNSKTILVTNLNLKYSFRISDITNKFNYGKLNEYYL